jgi:integrase
VLATRLMAYTWVRTKELRSIEPGHIKRAPAGWEWRVPGSVMKMKEELIVPLPRQALAIIEELRARMQPGQTYMLPNYRSPMTAAMSENAVLELVYRLGYKGKMTGHGWRTVASTWANERTNYKADAIERQLAHSPKKGQGGATRAAYNRAKYLAERREMMQAWADWLDAEQAKAEKRSKEPKAAKRARVPAVALAR